MSEDHTNKDSFILRPFGPAIAKVTIPIEIVNLLNEHIDKTIKDGEKIKELNYGHQLAGNVKQELILEKEIITQSGWGNFLSQSISWWIQNSLQKKITNIEILSTWIVRQFQNEYNPVHVNNGHISGVGYLKVPENLGKYEQENKKVNKNGTLTLIHGAKMFLSDSTFNIIPKVGEFYLFPNYLMHTVYPFRNDNNDERRSISFNAKIDENIFDVYSG